MTEPTIICPNCKTEFPLTESRAAPMLAATRKQLQAMSEEVGPARTLLVCCRAFRGDANRYANLTVKKIPKMVLQKCEWGHHDYSLNVENQPQAPRPAKPMAPQATLFDDSVAQE